MIYETEEDRRAEAVIMNTILFGGQAAIKLQDTHFADYAVAGKDNRVIAVFEIKDRPGWKEGYGTLFMTADKWCNLDGGRNQVDGRCAVPPVHPCGQVYNRDNLITRELLGRDLWNMMKVYYGLLTMLWM